VVQKAVQVLLNLEHRGATGSEANSGDGAGMLLQVPHAFLAARCDEVGIALPTVGRYGVGMVFLPTDCDSRRYCERIVEQIVAEEGQRVLGWRTVPTDNSLLGDTAKAFPTVHSSTIHCPQ
jgi:glutamate synthase (NADPH/NADH) large chain